MHHIIDKLQLKFNFPEYLIELGVPSSKTARKEKVQLGVTNAELMFIHENGSPLQNIPARPVLELTLKWVNESGLVHETLNKAIDAYLKEYNEEAVDKIMDRMCIKIQSYARKIIYDNDGRLVPNAPSTIAKKGDNDGRLVPNAPSTIAKKGDNHPLFDTGQLARSITCRAIRLKGGKS